MQKIIFIIFLILYISRFQLPLPLESQNTIMLGTIASIAETHQTKSNRMALEFLFIPDHSQSKIWIIWINPPPVHLTIGDRWELHLKIHSSHLSNWLISQNINAVATVQMDFKNQFIQYRNPYHYWIDHLRENIYQKIKTTLDNNSALGFICALTIGMRNDITQIQWEDLRATGTNHLMAIAGLHIGFMAFIIYHFFNFIWRRIPELMFICPAQESAILASLIAAIIYSALAGFSLPTQRAVIMLSIFLTAKLYRIKLSTWTHYFLALGIIAAYHPLSTLTPTFWLSFAAVGLLIYGYSGRVHHLSGFQHWTKAQWIMALGLIPLGLTFFQQVSFIGFIANSIAIPFVGFLILPLCFLGICIHQSWKIAAFLLSHFWIIIHYMGQIPHSQWLGEISNAEFISLFTGILLILAPKGFPHRWIGLWGFLPVIYKALYHS